MFLPIELFVVEWIFPTETPSYRGANSVETEGWGNYGTRRMKDLVRVHVAIHAHHLEFNEQTPSIYRLTTSYLPNDYETF